MYKIENNRVKDSFVFYTPHKMVFDKFGHYYTQVKTSHLDLVDKDYLERRLINIKPTSDVILQQASPQEHKGLLILTVTSTINLNEQDSTTKGYYYHTFENGSMKYFIPIKGKSKIIHVRSNVRFINLTLGENIYTDLLKIMNKTLEFNDEVCISSKKASEYIFLELVIEYSYTPEMD